MHFPLLEAFSQEKQHCILRGSEAAAAVALRASRGQHWQVLTGSHRGENGCLPASMGLGPALPLHCARGDGRQEQTPSQRSGQ